jgi:hypothetical protein
MYFLDAKKTSTKCPYTSNELNVIAISFAYWLREGLHWWFISQSVVKGMMADEMGDVDEM